jgi:two-component system nitrogen regulation response regulator NtrX
MKARILIVDDEKNIRRTLAMILEGAGYAVLEAESGEAALTMLAESPAEVVLLDVGLPGIDGITTLKRILAEPAAPSSIMISGQATVTMAVEATRLGAFDFLEKPLSKERVLIAVRNALRSTHLDQEVHRFQRGEARRHAMVGESEAIAALRRMIEKVGPTGATVLITGESGTGKELVARALHDSSPRAKGPFVKVNCAAIPEELIESELFGCVRGAYTGADRTREGKFLASDGGTIFLDEVGDMSLRVQAKVLRALQEGEIERVGDSKAINVDVRVIAATNKDLRAEAAAGRFRDDLFFRLNVIPIAVPPLRERSDDVERLCSHFLSLYASENDLPEKRIEPAALAILRGMDWKGNVRELRNVIERLAILSEGPTVTVADVRVLAGGAPGVAPVETGAPLDRSAALAPTVEEIRRAGGLVRARREFERRCIDACLDRSEGNVSEAARLLRIERSNLHKKMQALGLEARPPRPGSAGEQEGSKR